MFITIKNMIPTSLTYFFIQFIAYNVESLSSFGLGLKTKVFFQFGSAYSSSTLFFMHTLFS